MKVQKTRLLAAALGVVVGGSALAAEKPVAKPAAPAVAVGNQKLAEAVADKLTSSVAAHGADLSIETDNGTVSVLGTCKDAAQKAALMSAIRVVPGVRLVKDGLTVGPAAGVKQAQAIMPGLAPASPPAVIGGPAVEPAPLGHGGMGPGDGAAPPLPPYAWPTYAPHNNVSRVGYPTAYPYNAYPFIGPYYPFPKVPLGWRSVTLTWEDGHWWYGKTSTPHDYWRVRFW